MSAQEPNLWQIYMESGRLVQVVGYAEGVDGDGEPIVYAVGAIYDMAAGEVVRAGMLSMGRLRSEPDAPIFTSREKAIAAYRQRTGARAAA